MQNLVLHITAAQFARRVTAKVIEHGRGEKVIVFKKHRRKSYRKTQGHRQDYTALTITGINA